MEEDSSYPGSYKSSQKYTTSKYPGDYKRSIGGGSGHRLCENCAATDNSHPCHTAVCKKIYYAASCKKFTDGKFQCTQVQLTETMKKRNTNTPLWLVERRKQHKPRETMTIEMVMRKSFQQVVREYVQNCSIAGVKQMCDTSTCWKQRCLWAVILFSMFGLVCYFLLYTWYNTLANPLILMPQYTTYSIANIDYPAVAFCNVNRISKKAMKKMALEFFEGKIFGNVSLQDLESFIVESGRLLDFSNVETWGDKETIYLNIENHSRKGAINSQIVVDSMKRLAPSCKEMLMRCTWAGESVDCMSIFSTRRTARGHCCAFNYILDYDEDGYPNRTLKARRQILPGFMHGLNVIIDPMLDDYAYHINVVQGFDVLLFDPTHFADPSAGRVVHRLAEPNRLEYLELKSIKQTASNEVRKYPLSTRKCIFQDEKKSEFHDLYSYSACIVRCRTNALLLLCQCTPYFLPMRKGDGPVCLLSDLKCLNKYKEKLNHLHQSHSHATEEEELEDSLHCSGCLPDCEHTRHITKSYKTSIDIFSVDKYFAYGFAEGINLTNKCVLSIYYASPGGDLERLDVVSYWYQIISNIGGFGGVLIGISVFSVVEIVYFLFFRFLQVIYKNYKENH